MRMETADKLFERAKRLKAGELARLYALLESYLASEIDAPCSSSEEHRPDVLTLSGIGDSDYMDVSSHKAKHLARAYATRRDD
jgi:hypothetical protein